MVAAAAHGNHARAAAGGWKFARPHPTVEDASGGAVIRANIKRWLKIILGAVFLVLGVAGLFLPILQGILFLAIGISLLASEIEWVHHRLERARARHPKVAYVFDHAEAWLKRRWQSVTRNAHNEMWRLVMALCAAEVLTMVGVFAFPAVLPTLLAEWQLSNVEAGWIGGVYFAGYAAAVPVLVGLTDRVDARRIYVVGASVAAMSAAGFAAVADGFWSAMIFRALGGIGLAGTYMPGLRALVDRFHGPSQPRAIAFYTASFSLGTAASFLVIGELAAAFGWRVAFAVAAGSAIVAVALAALLPPVAPKPPVERTHLLDFRPVVANRPALGYILGYAVHCWELFGMRSWQVAFLVFAAGIGGGAAAGFSPTSVATVGALVAMVASIAGADLATRFDRARFCAVVMIVSAAVSAVIGFTAGLPYLVVALVSIVHAATIQLDSAALTTGTVQMAADDRRGATMALHSLLGFIAGFLGPLAVGAILDALGGHSEVAAWGAAFASLGVVSLLGPLALRLSRRR